MDTTNSDNSTNRLENFSNAAIHLLLSDAIMSDAMSAVKTRVELISELKDEAHRRGLL